MSAPGLAARRAAGALVDGVLADRRPLSEQTGTEGPLGRLAPEDRARAQALATRALRHLDRIDSVLAGFIHRKPPSHARTALRLAAAELLAEGAPAHAAVDGAVRLVRGHPRGRHVAGLVNAVARRIATEGPARWDAAPEAGSPDWIAGPVAAAWGAEAARAIAAAHRRDAPPVDVTPRDPSDDTLARDLGAARLPTGSLRLPPRVRVSGLPGYAEGRWWVQDAAAALPARLVGAGPGERVLDLCAAPGGKTLQLAAAGARVTALDVSDKRLGRLRENLARTGLAAEIVVADALDWTPAEAFDAVLVDAPCTATGTLRRHPDLPYLRGAEDVPALVELQKRLLERVWGWVRPGGKLVFCTCSILPAEGEEQARAFLAAHAEAQPVRPDATALGIEPDWIDSEGGLRLRPDYWPERGGMDGFYAATFTKAAVPR